MTLHSETTQPEVTISEAVEAYGDKRSTVNSWVRKGKVKSRKILKGKKEIILIDVTSLKDYRATRPSNNKTNTESQPKPGDKQTAADDSSIAQISSQDTGGNDTPKSRKKGRKKPRVKLPRQHAKNLMRPFSNDDLLNVRAWIDQRLNSRLDEHEKPCAT